MSKPLSQQVRELEQRLAQTADLLGEVLANLSMAKNRHGLQQSEPGRILCTLADQWKRRYDALTEPRAQEDHSP